jgi:hypothetical protein
MSNARVQETVKEVRRLDREARGGLRVGSGRAGRHQDRRKEAARKACRSQSRKGWA